MSNITPTAGWDNVYLIETSDDVLAGPGGIANRQAQALLNRTEHLKNVNDAQQTSINTVQRSFRSALLNVNLTSINSAVKLFRYNPVKSGLYSNQPSLNTLKFTLNVTNNTVVSAAYDFIFDAIEDAQNVATEIKSRIKLKNVSSYKYIDSSAQQEFYIIVVRVNEGGNYVYDFYFDSGSDTGSHTFYTVFYDDDLLAPVSGGSTITVMGMITLETSLSAITKLSTNTFSSQHITSLYYSGSIYSRNPFIEIVSNPVAVGKTPITWNNEYITDIKNMIDGIATSQQLKSFNLPVNLSVSTPAVKIFSYLYAEKSGANHVFYNSVNRSFKFSINFSCLASDEVIGVVKRNFEFCTSGTEFRLKLNSLSYVGNVFGTDSAQSMYLIAKRRATATQFFVDFYLEDKKASATKTKTIYLNIEDDKSVSNLINNITLETSLTPLFSMANVSIYGEYLTSLFSDLVDGNYDIFTQIVSKNSAIDVSPVLHNNDYYISNYTEEPIKTVKMWYGTVETIPVGWALCNGLNGTPNLTDKFVIGAGSLVLGATGGVVTHTHTLSIAQDGLHYHGIAQESLPVLGGEQTYTTLDTANVTGYAGAHLHAGSTANASDARPPFVALYYIMKISRRN